MAKTDDIFLVAGRICPQGAYRALVAEAETTAILLALRLPSVARSKLPVLETLFMRCVRVRSRAMSKSAFHFTTYYSTPCFFSPARSYATPVIDIELPHMPTELFFHLQAVVFAHEVRLSEGIRL